MRWKNCLATLLALLAVADTRLAAENIDLSTVPTRETVQLTIYNSEDITLVRETRHLSFKRGVNPLQFSWANTLIDPTSVELRFLTHADKLDVLDTTFLHDKPQMLYWNVQSDHDGEATVEIKYFTSGITWAADYLCTADADEQEMGFEGFVRVSNNSGEEYENAEVRLVVGTINLVEKIAQLAHPQDVSQLPAEEFTKLRRDVAMDALSRQMPAANAPASDAQKPKEIIKEGLSEYFIYTVEGTETISNGWSKRIRSFSGQTVPLRIEYRYRAAEYGDQLVRMYILTNNKVSKLGTTPLPDGVVRVFRDNGRQGLSYLTSQTIKYVPIGDKIELNLGPDRQVLFELVKRKVRRDNIWIKREGQDEFEKVGAEGVEIDPRGSVAGWDEHTLYAQRIRNFSGKPIEVEIRRSIEGHAIFRSLLEPVLFDYQTVQFRAGVPAGKRDELPYEVVVHQGRNARQNNVTLQKANVTR